MTKRAVCVGIDAYAPPYKLSGCVNDANLWAKTLQGLGFEPPEVLTDGEATRQGILDSLKGLVGEAKPGDVVVFQFAGHGTQVPDLDGDEVDDDKDESLVPFDYGTGAYVIDDDIWDVLQDLRDDVDMTVMCDCCHSGSNTRAFGLPSDGASDGKTRFIKATDEMNEAHRSFRKRLGGPRVQRSAEQMKWVNFSACQPHQLAKEKNGNGVFTRYATTVIEDGVAGMTNEQFQKRVVKAFGGNASQLPYLDCKPAAHDQPFLGSASTRAFAPTAVPTPGNEVADFLEALTRLLRSKTT